jgi:hypothetical protein
VDSVVLKFKNGAAEYDDGQVGSLGLTDMFHGGGSPPQSSYTNSTAVIGDVALLRTSLGLLDTAFAKDGNAESYVARKTLVTQSGLFGIQEKRRRPEHTTADDES